MGIVQRNSSVNIDRTYFSFDDKRGALIPTKKVRAEIAGYENQKPVFKRDANGKPLFILDENGKFILDSNGASVMMMPEDTRTPDHLKNITAYEGVLYDAQLSEREAFGDKKVKIKEFKFTLRDAASLEEGVFTLMVEQADNMSVFEDRNWSVINALAAIDLNSPKQIGVSIFTYGKDDKKKVYYRVYDPTAAKGEKIATKWKKGEKVYITPSSETELKLKKQGKKVFVCNQWDCAENGESIQGIKWAAESEETKTGENGEYKIQIGGKPYSDYSIQEVMLAECQRMVDFFKQNRTSQSQQQTPQETIPTDQTTMPTSDNVGDDLPF